MAGAMMLTNINVGNLLARAEENPILLEADFLLYANGQVADIYMDTGNELQPVIRAVGDLQEDIQMVTGKLPEIHNNENSVGKNAIIIGTLGESDVIGDLVAAGKLDVSQIQNKWEAFTMQIIENPSEGIDSAIVIAGSDKRGTIFGIYDLSEEMGISPWYWWADVPVEQKDAIVFDDIDIEKTEMPDVKYRGIFLNDEENFTVYLKNNQWNLITTTITDENVAVYVNGSLVLETRDKNYVAGQNVEHLTRIITLLQSAETIEIGGNNHHWGSAEFFADKFALYDKALSEQEVLKEYLGTITESELMSLIEEAEKFLGEQAPPAVDEETESSTDIVTDDESVTMDGTESTEDSVKDENSENIENATETGDHADYLKYWFGVVGIGMLFIVMRKKKYQNVHKY